VGLDYAGPFTQVSLKITEKETVDLPKIWVLVITCLTSRACHFEAVHDQSTTHFIYAFQRFMHRRGYCRYVYSDNSKTFKKADRELQGLFRKLDWARIERECLSLPSKVEWRWISPYSPHWGGIYEKICGSMKKALYSTLGRRKVSLQEFQTALTAAEAVCNSRPLTVVTNDPRDPLPITPSHIALGRPIQFLPDNLAIDDPTSRIAVVHLVQNSELSL